MDCSRSLSTSADNKKLGYLDPSSQPSSNAKSAESLGGYRSGSLTSRSANIPATISRQSHNDRGRSSQDLKTGDNLHAFGVVESAEDRTLRDDTSSSVDTTLHGDRAGSKDIVSGTHLDGNASAVAGGDGLADTRAEGIFDTSDGHESHIAREVLVIDLVGRLEAGIGRGPRLKVPVTERDGPQHLPRL
jgi:hypothetical protein